MIKREYFYTFKTYRNDSATEISGEGCGIFVVRSIFPSGTNAFNGVRSYVENGVKNHKDWDGSTPRINIIHLSRI